jgi:hypothetical protein
MGIDVSLICDCVQRAWKIVRQGNDGGRKWSSGVMGTKETWEKINREPVSQDIHLKPVMRGCLAFIRGTDVGMFCAY